MPQLFAEISGFPSHTMHGPNDREEGSAQATVQRDCSDGAGGAQQVHSGQSLTHVWHCRCDIGCSKFYYMPTDPVLAQVIPDTVLMAKAEQLELKAATVSSSVLAGMLGNPGIAREYQVTHVHLSCCIAN